jgi:DNA replication protein DnaC
MSPNPTRGDYRQWIAETEARHAKAQATHDAFLAAFTSCPGGRGEPVPCRLDEPGCKLNLHHPDLRMAVPCPIAKQEGCAPYRLFEELEARQLREQRRRRGRRLGLPARFLDARFETARPTAAVERVRQYLAEDAVEAGRALVLLGGTGCGKTHAVACGLYDAPARSSDEYQRPRDGRFVFWPELCARLMDPARRAEALAIARLDALLVLDDVGAGYVKEASFLEALIEELFWVREAEVLPTLVTSNLPPDALTSLLGDRVADRLRGEWGGVFSCAGPSLRRGTGGA